MISLDVLDSSLTGRRPAHFLNFFSFEVDSFCCCLFPELSMSVIWLLGETDEVFLLLLRRLMVAASPVISCSTPRIPRVREDVVEGS